MATAALQRGMVILSALINFVDWLDSEEILQLPEQERGELVKRFLDAHQTGENYFMQAEQIAEALGVPFEGESDKPTAATGARDNDNDTVS